MSQRSGIGKFEIPVGSLEALDNNNDPETFCLSEEGFFQPSEKATLNPQLHQVTRVNLLQL